MAQAEKKIYLLEKVRGCVKTIHSDSGYLSFAWKVGVSPRPCAVNVCRTCFLNVYECSHGLVENIVRDIKDGIRSYDRPTSASSGRVNLTFIGHLERLASHFGLTLTRAQIQAMTIPNSVESLTVFSWLQSFFDSVGEKQPTMSEIHLDPCTVTDIYKEYKQVMEDAGEVSLLRKYLLHLCHNISFFRKLSRTHN